MKEPKHWIKIHEATIGHHEMLESLQQDINKFIRWLFK